MKHQPHREQFASLLDWIDRHVENVDVLQESSEDSPSVTIYHGDGRHVSFEWESEEQRWQMTVWGDHLYEWGADLYGVNADTLARMLLLGLQIAI